MDQDYTHRGDNYGPAPAGSGDQAGQAGLFTQTNPPTDLLACVTIFDIITSAEDDGDRWAFQLRIIDPSLQG